MQNKRKPVTRFALVEYDPIRLSQLDIQAEGMVFARMIREGLLGRDHAHERGIVQISRAEAPLITPAAGIDGQMTVD